jgi:hypothetical protein
VESINIVRGKAEGVKPALGKEYERPGTADAQKVCQG